MSTFLNWCHFLGDTLSITVLFDTVTFFQERALYEQRRHGVPQINIEELERRRENEQNGDFYLRNCVFEWTGSVVGSSSCRYFLEHKATQRLSISMDPVVILRALARPDSGLQVKNRKWLKILVPMSFIGELNYLLDIDIFSSGFNQRASIFLCEGRDLVDWLLEHVEDLSDRKAARQYAAELLRAGLIRHVVSKLTFTEKCYYVFGGKFT